MARCNRCGRTWRTLPGEEQDHDCPACGDITSMELATGEAMSLNQALEAQQVARRLPCETMTHKDELDERPGGLKW